MSFTKTIDQINAETAKYAPAVLAGVLAVEKAAAGLPGQTKQEIVVNTIVTGAQSAAKAAEGVSVPAVSAVGALVDIIVAILNAAGLFTHGNPGPASTPVAK